MEYALVLFAFLASVLAMAAVWRAGREGAFLDRIVEAASHSFAAGLLGSSKDILMY